MTGIYGALQAIGYGLLVLFFAAGVVKTCGSFAEVRRPEQALKLFQEGTGLVKTCDEMLSEAELQVVKLMKGADGAPVETEYTRDE